MGEKKQKSIGVIGMFNRKRGFGVVNLDDGRRAYVSRKELPDSRFVVYPGQHIACDVVMNSKNNWRATHVECISKSEAQERRVSRETVSRDVIESSIRRLGGDDLIAAESLSVDDGYRMELE